MGCTTSRRITPDMSIVGHPKIHVEAPSPKSYSNVRVQNPVLSETEELLIIKDSELDNTRKNLDRVSTKLTETKRHVRTLSKQLSRTMSELEISVKKTAKDSFYIDEMGLKLHAHMTVEAHIVSISEEVQTNLDQLLGSSKKDRQVKELVGQINQAVGKLKVCKEYDDPFAIFEAASRCKQ